MPLRTTYGFLDASAYNAVVGDPDPKHRMAQIAIYSKAFAGSPNAKNANLVAVESLAEMNDTAKLSEFGEKALAADPNNIGLLTLLANAYVEDPQAYLCRQGRRLRAQTDRTGEGGYQPECESHRRIWARDPRLLVAARRQDVAGDRRTEDRGHDGKERSGEVLDHALPFGLRVCQVQPDGAGERNPDGSGERGRAVPAIVERLAAQGGQAESSEVARQSIVSPSIRSSFQVLSLG